MLAQYEMNLHVPSCSVNAWCPPTTYDVDMVGRSSWGRLPAVAGDLSPGFSTLPCIFAECVVTRAQQLSKWKLCVSTSAKSVLHRQTHTATKVLCCMCTCCVMMCARWKGCSMPAFRSLNSRTKALAWPVTYPSAGQSVLSRRKCKSEGVCSCGVGHRSSLSLGTLREKVWQLNILLLFLSHIIMLARLQRLPGRSQWSACIQGAALCGCPMCCCSC